MRIVKAYTNLLPDFMGIARFRLDSIFGESDYRLTCRCFMKIP